ncbi:uncharacterized protein ColSpa_01075 [Colletotrichum spaethianum]|uniref:Apple domain-containing protein n=1 Tax=Colletotrichum spaethianum TaxID=700344 RepID=A0AA37P6X2_9PEZI|nr:uncharacterized protein ColSpa_01075 [Colletotrichum spaethianum]GKT40894.1 hypothetical protein ColSpa_01075 [Colletotrichum spaethianum]
MVFNKSLLAAIALMAHIANAEEAARGLQLSQSPPRTVTGEQGCYTDFGRSWRGSVPTYSRLYSYTFPVTEYIYTTPTTSTVTITPTISAGSAGTTTSTVTTTTHISSFTTVTVRAPARFTPLASVIAEAGNAPGLRESADEAHMISGDTDYSLSLSVDKDGRCATKPFLWPQAVVCEKVVRVFTTTTSTITATRAATTTTILPGPTAQTTVTTTTTTTSTITDVAANPTQTVYDACQTNNLRAYHGQPRSYFVEAVHDWFITREERRTGTPESCCIACQTTSDCGGSLYHLFSGTCYIFKSRGNQRQCQSPGKLRSTMNITTSGVFWASNGGCGSWRISNEEPGSST